MPLLVMRDAVAFAHNGPSDAGGCASSGSWQKVGEVVHLLRVPEIRHPGQTMAAFEVAPNEVDAVRRPGGDHGGEGTAFSAGLIQNLEAARTAGLRQRTGIGEEDVPTPNAPPCPRGPISGCRTPVVRRPFAEEGQRGVRSSKMGTCRPPGLGGLLVRVKGRERDEAPSGRPASRPPCSGRYFANFSHRWTPGPPAGGQ